MQEKKIVFKIQENVSFIGFLERMEMSIPLGLSYPSSQKFRFAPEANENHIFVYTLYM